MTCLKNALYTFSTYKTTFGQSTVSQHNYILIPKEKRTGIYKKAKPGHMSQCTIFVHLLPVYMVGGDESIWFLGG